jgi:hypothetical protein
VLLVLIGASVGLKGAGMPRLGLGEHRPDEPLEQIDYLIGQRWPSSRVIATRVAWRRCRS